MVAARGDSARISTARAGAVVTRVEVQKPIRFLGSTSHTATRGLDAGLGLGLTGEGVSVAVIDSGVDPTPGVISVASYDDQETGTRDGAVSDFSSRGLATDPATWPDISAPGESIASSCRLHLLICATGLKPQNGPRLLDLGTFNTISGTSMAAPHIAGIVAQLFQAEPSATPADIERALKSTAHKYGTGHQPTGPHTSSFDRGTGLVDVVAAINVL